jgi:SPP1 family predicted phage head-tail adaptor
MQISEMNKRITLQCVTKLSDGMGSFAETWNDMDTVWAKKTTHRSDESVQSLKNTGTAIHNFRIRYRRDVKASWRVKEGQKLMAIVGPPIEVDKGPGRHWLDLTVSEVG